MISANEWKAYNDGVSKISDAAEKETTRRLLAWRALNPDASVAESREFAKEVMAAVVQSYDGMAASFAAEWYDYRAEKGGARLDQAVTSAVYSPESADEVARNQAKKLAKGDFEGFAKACGEYARNDALRSLNETIMANAKRDRKKGVRFARVPTGLETWTFCLMLASRGAVYHSRKTAGEFKHFHRRCDCKVVPGFEDDPDAELVEGVRPKGLRDVWKRFSEIDSYGLPRAQSDALKYASLDHAQLHDGALQQQHAVFANALEVARKSAWSDFSRNKTLANYKETVVKFVKMLGKEYGVEWECRTSVNSCGTTVYANPNGDELWVACRLAEVEQYLAFLPADQSFIPDVVTATGYAEIKCPSSANIVSARLRHANEQLAVMADGEKTTYLGLQRMSDVQRARYIAADMISRGQVANVVCVLPDGSIEEP